VTELTIFFDRCTGSGLPKLLRKTKPPFVVQFHDDRQNGFRQTTPDDEWLSVAPLSGMLPEGQNQVHTVQVTTSNMVPGGYNANIIISSNDPNNLEIEVPVTLDIITSIGENQQSGIELFPNPAKDEVFIKSDKTIIRINMISLLGKVLLEKKVEEIETSLDVSDLEPGVYLVEVECAGRVAVRKLVVE